MKRLLCSVILAAAAIMQAFSQPIDPDNLPEFKFKDQGLERSYFLYIPENLPEGAPLLFYLHGYGNTHPTNKGFCAVAEKEKFALCIPWAAVDPNNKHGWNVGYDMQKGYKVDDVKFIKRLAKHLQKEYNLSKTNVFVSGNSNGGEMCYLIAYREPKFFKAVAPTSGLTMKWMFDKLTPKQAIPLIEIHGTEDRTSEWNGLLDNHYWGPYCSVPLAVANWAIAAGCCHEVTEKLPLASPEAHQVIAHKFESDTNGGVQVQLYEVIGSGHKLSTADFNYHQVIWDFFKQYLD